MNNTMHTATRLSRRIAVLLLMAAAPLCAGAQTIEYFWNTDPGIGRGQKLATAAQADGYASVQIDAADLSHGANLLGMRAAVKGRWSQTHTYLVMIPASTGEADWHAEYFCDEDPGPGLATPIDAAVAGNGGIVDVELLAADLAPGVHTLGFRARSAGIWSQTVTATVYVPREGSTLIAQAEYFWGADPGLGAGTPIDLPGQTDGQTVTVDALTLDFPTEVADEYVLSFRARSEEGWGTTVTKIIPHLYVEEITLSTDTLILAPDSTAQLTATLTPEDAFVSVLEWSSSDDAVATVDADGKVTAVSQGKATITARSTDGSDVSASCEVTVVRLVSDITLSETSLTLTEGADATLTATVAPESADNKALVWASSNEAVAKVDADGKVTAVSQGKAMITVRSTDGSDVSATCEVTVVRLVSDILLSESEVNLIEGESLRITATVLPENATDTSLRWYSLDEVIATVDDGLIYAMAPGETTIVAEATDGSGVRAECHVVVEDADGIGSIAGGVSILVQQGCIVVSGLPAGESVKVYSINGTNIFHARSQGSDIVIRPNGKGVYVVVLGTQSYKVIVH